MNPNTHWLSKGLLGIFLEFKSDFLWVMLFSMIANLLSLTPTIFMLQVYDRVMVSQNELTLLALTLTMVIFLGVMAFAEWIRSKILVRAGLQFDQKLNSKIFFSSFVPDFDHSKSDNIRYFTSLTRLRQFLTGSGVISFLDLPWTPVYLAVLYLMHPMLGWFGLGFTLLLGILAFGGNKFLAKSQEKAQDKEALTNAFFANKLRNAEVVEVMGMSSNLKQRWLTLYQDHSFYYSQAGIKATQYKVFLKFIQYSQQSIVLALGAWLTIKGELTMGSLVASNVLMSNALKPISGLVGIWKDYVSSRHALQDIEQLLQKSPPKSSAYSNPKMQGKFTLQNLYAYSKLRDAPILSDVSMDFESGEVVAIVGPSGAGKSTLLRCLIGIWTNYSGKVLLDGIEISDWSRNALGPLIGYLPQRIDLLEGTVAENICRFGEINAKEIVKAANTAGIHELILRLPQGYDTSIGEAGKTLSGGQKQRLGLARAIYGLPKIVLLDEPNANLDESGEAALALAISELKKNGTTVFMVLHHRQFLSLADKILVVRDGQVHLG